MHDLEAIKSACINALNDEQDNQNGIALFREVADPASVLELVTMVQASITAHELETLTRVIRNLIDYVEAVPDDDHKAVHLDRQELIRY
ncbi:MAG TPA: hypothetical protein VIE65_09065, partial [Methylobacter sp.]